MTAAPARLAWDYALPATRPGGTCTSVGIYYQQQLRVPILPMHGVGVRLELGRVTDHLAPLQEADRAFLAPEVKCVVHRN